MRIVDLIRRELIIPALSATKKPDIIHELAGHIAAETDAFETETLERVLTDRESLASTAIGQGVAIPHAKLPGISEILAAIGRARGGVDFDSMDGEPTFLFFVMVAPENSTGTHLKALARISRVFKDEGFRKQLLEAPDADTMYELIDREDAKY